VQYILSSSISVNSLLKILINFIKFATFWLMQNKINVPYALCIQKGIGQAQLVLCLLQCTVKLVSGVRGALAQRKEKHVVSKEEMK